MNVHVRPLTETELAAHNRRRQFHEMIAAKAAALTAPKPPAPIASALEPEAMPAETDPPLTKRPWFSIIGVLRNSLSVQQVKRAVCDEFNLTQRELISPRRIAQLVLARQVGMYLCRELIPERSYPQIGFAFGRVDHTTVLHACRVLPVKMARNPDLALRVEKLRADLEQCPREVAEQ